MATFRKRLGKWEVRVRRYSNATLSKTFLEKADADKWAREVEVKIEKGLYEDLSQANTITLRELLQTYFKDVSTTKLGVNEEKYKIDKLCRQPIAGLKLARLTPLQVRKFQDACLLIYNPEYAWPVQYVDGEMDAYDMIERTSPYIHAFGQPQKDFFQICNFSLQKDQTIPDIKDEVGQGLIQRMLERQEASTGKKPILFLDNLRSLSNYVENDSDSWRPIGVWLKNLRGLGYTIIVIDHTGKAAPGPRGTSSKTDWANVCIKIESDGKRGDKLMKCKISFDKARGLRPEDTAEYSCSYDFEGNWNLATSNKDLEDEEYIEQIKIITADGAKITQKAIADELGISVGKVNSLIKKIKAAPKKTGVFN